MATPFHPAAPAVPHARGAEQRRRDRVTGPFPAFVRGVNAAGKAFELDSVLENISWDGVYLLVPEPVDIGTTLFLVTTLPQQDGLPTPRLALRGRVIRI